MKNSVITAKSDRKLCILFGTLSFCALLAAYISEFMGYKPCILCIYQRVPYFIILFAALIIYFFKPNYIILRYTKYLITTLLVIEFGIAFYHVLIEHHIIAETASCQTQLLIKEDIEKTLELIRSQEATSCAKPELFILGLSTAEWNCLYSLCLFVYSFRFRGFDATRR